MELVALQGKLVVLGEVMLETKPTAVVVALGHSSCETTTMTKCGLGGSELKCMNQIIMTESRAAFIKGRNAENPSQSDYCYMQPLWASLKQL